MWIPVIDGALELQCAIGRIYPLKRGDGLGIVGAATGEDTGRYQQNCGCAPVGIEKEPLRDGADERGSLTQSSSDPKEIQRMTCTSEDAQ